MSYQAYHITPSDEQKLTQSSSIVLFKVMTLFDLSEAQYSFSPISTFSNFWLWEYE